MGVYNSHAGSKFSPGHFFIFCLHVWLKLLPALYNVCWFWSRWCCSIIKPTAVVVFLVCCHRSTNMIMDGAIFRGFPETHSDMPNCFFNFWIPFYGHDRQSTFGTQKISAASGWNLSQKILKKSQESFKTSWQTCKNKFDSFSPERKDNKTVICANTSDIKEIIPPQSPTNSPMFVCDSGIVAIEFFMRFSTRLFSLRPYASISFCASEDDFVDLGNFLRGLRK